MTDNVYNVWVNHVHSPTDCCTYIECIIHVNIIVNMGRGYSKMISYFYFQETRYKLIYEYKVLQAKEAMGLFKGKTI